MSLRDRIRMGMPIGKTLEPILDELITAVNKLSAVVFEGTSPHKADDTADVVTTDNATDLETVVDLEKALDAAYVAHIASTTYHLAADSTNTLTATTVYAKIKALADDIKAKYNLHHVYTTSSVHAGSGDPNTVTEAAVSSKATAVDLLNDIKAMFNLHIVNVTSCHGSTGIEDAIADDDLDSESTWSEIAAFADSARASYVAHIAQGSTIHGAADEVNTLTAAAIGAVQTSVNAYLTELKGDFNGHLVLLSSHRIADTSMQVSAAAATSLATSKTLANAIKESFNDHISRAAEVALTVSTLDEV